MTAAGAKIIEGLKDAVAGNFSAVTIEGQRWVRAPEWLPIETAPASNLDDDPIIILLWVADGGDRGKGSATFGCCCRRNDGVLRPMATGYYGDWKITHWMPLPEPPVSA